METTKLTGTIYCVDNDVMFLELFNSKENVYEYYFKEYDRHDFEYQLGVTEPFTPKQLAELYDQGYFN